MGLFHTPLIPEQWNIYLICIKKLHTRKAFFWDTQTDTGIHLISRYSPTQVGETTVTMVTAVTSRTIFTATPHNPHGYGTPLPQTQLLCYWYNGSNITMCFSRASDKVCLVVLVGRDMVILFCLDILLEEQCWWWFNHVIWSKWSSVFATMIVAQTTSHYFQINM